MDSKLYPRILSHASSLFKINDYSLEDGYQEHTRRIFKNSILVIELDTGRQPPYVTHPSGHRERIRDLGVLVNSTPLEIQDGVSKRSPLVSVIVPTHNRPQMLKVAIESILEQTFQDFEIIVVNDAGEDVSSVIESFASTKVTYLSHKTNKGLAASRNTGIRNARGKYIAYLDDDDIFFPDHLNTLASFLENNDYKIAYTDAYRIHQVITDKGYIETGRDIPYSFDFDPDLLLRQNYIPVLCFMHHKSSAEEVGLFDEELKALEDWDLWIRMSRKFNFAHLRRVTCGFTWRTDGSSMTSNLGHNPQWARSRSIIFEKYKEIMGKSSARIHNASGNTQESSLNRIRLVSIVILSLNQKEWTLACLRSIQNHTSIPYEIIIVDNGSNKDTVDALIEYTDRNDRVTLILNAQNHGFAEGNNQALPLAKGDYVLLLNNDTLATSGWLEGMIRVLDEHPETGIVGPMSNYVAGPQIVESARYSSIPEMEAFASRWRDGHRGESLEASMVIGFCMLMRRKVIEAIGGMDGIFGIGNFEDMDFCYRATLAGFRIRIAREVFVHHQGSQTFKAEKVDYIKTMKKNWELFKAKWGLEPGVKMKEENIVVKKADAIRQHIALPLLQKTHEPRAHARLWVERSYDSILEGRNGEEIVPLEEQGSRHNAFGRASESADRGHPLVFAGSTTPQVSIIIPTYQNLRLTRQCVEGILHNTSNVAYEIIIVDNHSTDGTESYLREMQSKGILKALINSSNMGFSHACNQGAKAAQSPFLLFLNNDTFPKEGWLSPLLQTAIGDERIGVIGAKLLYPDGKVQHAGMALIHHNRGEKLSHPIPGHPHRLAESDDPRVNQYRELDMVTGACILVRRDLFFVLGGFDEVYRNGVEDVDFCLRARYAGYKVAYQPESVVIHHEGQSPGRFDPHHVSRNLQIYFARWEKEFDGSGALITPEPARIIRSQISMLNGDQEKIASLSSQSKASSGKGLRIC